MGDGRYCSLSRTLSTVHDWWAEHDERGGLPTSLLDGLDSVVRQDLPRVIETEDPSSGGMLARELRETIAQLIAHWEQ